MIRYQIKDRILLTFPSIILNAATESSSTPWRVSWMLPWSTDQRRMWPQGWGQVITTFKGKVSWKLSTQDIHILWIPECPYIDIDFGKICIFFPVPNDKARSVLLCRYILITSGSDGLMREQEGGLMPFEDNRCEEEDSRDPVVGTEGQQI